jgi:hypothetical protein
VSRESRAAVARSQRLDRLTVGGIGALAAAGGAAALVVSAGWLGRPRASRPLADPMALQWLRAHQLWAQVGALVAGVLLVLLGLWLASRTLRREPRPDLVLEVDGNPGETAAGETAAGETAAGGLLVTAHAVTEAIRVDAESVSGVAEARARVVRIGDTPALRLQLWLRHGADVHAVWSELDKRVLTRARESLGVPAIPTAIRLELGSAQRQRVK